MTDEEIKLRLQPKKAIREELGGGYFYRCPWLTCDKVVRSDFEWCPWCGQRLEFEVDSYTRREDG